MPIVVNTYEVLETLNDPEPDTFSLSEPQEPIFTTLSIEQYNKALQNSIEKYSYNKAKAEEYEKNKTTDDKEAAENYKNQLSPETSTKLIDTEKLAITCSGDPSGYYHDRDELLEKTGAPNPGDQSDTDNAKATVNVTNNTTLEMAGMEISFADVDTNEGEISLSNDISFKLGAKMTVPALIFDMEYESSVSVGFAAEIGYTGGRTNTNGISFGVEYIMPERELMDGVSISGDDDQYTKTKGRIFHYDPKNDPTYRYNAHSICYQLSDYSVDRHVDDSETNVDMNDGDSVFVHTFYTTGLADPVPAEPPEDFGVQSVRKVGGDAEVTLIWNSRHRSDERWADGYNLYVNDSGGNNPTVYLVNQEALIPSADLKTEDYVPADTPLYTTYTVHLKEGFYNPDAPVTFYIAPAYRDKNTGDVKEGTLCAKTTVGNINNATNGALGIIKQPENYYMSSDDNEETATFSLDAQKNVAGGDEVSFIWQTYNRESGEWENGCTDTPGNQNAATFHSEYRFIIPAGNKESYVDMGVRCVAEYDNFSVTSDVVTIRYIDQKPEPSSTPDEPPAEPDEPTGLPISNYDELVAFAKRVNDGENTLDAYLTNNITVPDGAQWTVGIGTEFKSYNGTFNGRDYGIDGLQLNISDNGGLFGIIGKKGVVKDLAVIGSSCQSVPTYAGGIAALNYGTIDHCVSGVNLAEPEEGLRNSTVSGTISGGITAQNKGIITGCRSAAVVNGVCCGGIAGMNDGRIYGCASNGPVGTDTTECAGGIVGENDGSIQSAYISGAVSCKSGDGVKGWISGKNSSENVDYVLYPTSDDTQAFGSSSAETGENISDIADSDMKKPLFVKIMNEITDDTVTWVQAQYGDTCLNMGYPTIQGNYLKQRTLSLQNGITVSGTMHSDLQVMLEELAAESDAYKAFASKGSVLSAYSVRIVDSNGNLVSSELWSAGGYQLHIPTNGKNIALLAYNAEGELVTVPADRVEDGIAVFTVADIGSFAVIEAAAPSHDAASSTKDSADGDPADKATDSTVTGNSASVVGGTAVTGNSASAVGGTAIQTGEAVSVVMFLLLLGAVCVFVFLRRRSQGQDK